MLMFNNCSQQKDGSSFTQSQSSSRFVFFNNNGQMPEKVLYDHFTKQPGCIIEEGAPIGNLYVSYQKREAEFQLRECESSFQEFEVFDQVQSNGYNPNFVKYRNLLFARSELHGGIPESLYYNEFCFNEVEQIDFSIQYIKIKDPSPTGPDTEWVGLKMYGPMTSEPGIHFNSGYLSEIGPNRKQFEAKNGSYKVIIDESDPVSKAQLVTKKGETTDMLCW